MLVHKDKLLAESNKDKEEVKELWRVAEAQNANLQIQLEDEKKATNRSKNISNLNKYIYFGLGALAGAVTIKAVSN